MTTPEERTKSILDTRDFPELLAGAGDVAIPGLVASVAKGLLRHYPLTVDLVVSASTLPGIWADPDTGGPKGRAKASVVLLAAPDKP